jgi:hypothetical protein
MAFMELETLNDVWYTVETEGGESFLIPESVCGYLVIPSGHTEAEEGDCTPEDWESICASVCDYTDGRKVMKVEAAKGWAARYSAPGYMDCTDWGGVYETEEEAAAEAKEMYGDDEEDEEEGDDESAEPGGEGGGA